MLTEFLDTNVILRHLLADNAEQSQRATKYLAGVERGETAVVITDTVVFEIVFTLEKVYHIEKSDIRNMLLPLLELPGVNLPGKKIYREVFDLYAELNIPFADAYHGVTARHLKSRRIVSFDRHFDRITKLTRVEP